jgi:hypothetical protein
MSIANCSEWRASDVGWPGKLVIYDCFFIAVDRSRRQRHHRTTKAAQPRKLRVWTKERAAVALLAQRTHWPRIAILAASAFLHILARTRTRASPIMRIPLAAIIHRPRCAQQLSRETRKSVTIRESVHPCRWSILTASSGEPARAGGGPPLDATAADKAAALSTSCRVRAGSSGRGYC